MNLPRQPKSPRVPAMRGEYHTHLGKMSMRKPGRTARYIQLAGEAKTLRTLYLAPVPELCRWSLTEACC